MTDESRTEQQTSTFQKGRNLPKIYMAGRMGKALDNKRPGGEFSCWRLFDVGYSASHGELEIDNSPYDVLIAEPELKTFHGTNVKFMYSGPWKARGSNHGYIHGVTSCSPDWAQSAAYRGAIQAITRSDILVAFLEDAEAFGTLVEIGYARALNKRIIIVTTTAFGPAVYENDLWFALKTADRHLTLEDHQCKTDKEKWEAIHKLVASAISEWYPSSAL